MTGAVAAVDCGTNSTRLLVADASGATLERLMTITRLGQGVDATGALAPDAVARTVHELHRYRQVMDRYGVGPVRMIATSAARDASNRDAFFGAACRAVGVEAELLDGDEEGRLSFAGATAELDPGTGPWLVVDVGGGSTELAVGPAAPAGPGRHQPTTVRSLQLGCVRVTERFLAHDPPLGSELDVARSFLRRQLDAAAASAPALAEGRTLIGLAGTVSAAAALDQSLEHYDRSALHHYRLGSPAVRRLLDDLAGEDAAARRRRPGMETDRADVIVGGLLVLDVVLERFGLGECLTSESDILDGLVQTLLAA